MIWIYQKYLIWTWRFPIPYKNIVLCVHLWNELFIWSMILIWREMKEIVRVKSTYRSGTIALYAICFLMIIRLLPWIWTGSELAILEIKYEESVEWYTDIFLNPTLVPWIENFNGIWLFFRRIWRVFVPLWLSKNLWSLIPNWVIWL